MLIVLFVPRFKFLLNVVSWERCYSLCWIGRKVRFKCVRFEVCVFHCVCFILCVFHLTLSFECLQLNWAFFCAFIRLIVRFLWNLWTLCDNFMCNNLAHFICMDFMFTFSLLLLRIVHCLFFVIYRLFLFFFFLVENRFLFVFFGLDLDANAVRTAIFALSVLSAC